MSHESGDMTDDWTVDRLFQVLDHDDESMRLEALVQLSRLALACQLDDQEPRLSTSLSPSRVLQRLRHRLSDERHRDILTALVSFMMNLLPVMLPDLEYVYDLILPELIPLLSHELTFDTPDHLDVELSPDHNAAFEVLVRYAALARDHQGVLDTLLELGLRHPRALVREKSVLGIPELARRVASERRRKTLKNEKIRRLDFSETLAPLVDLLDDVDASVVVAAQDTIGWMRGSEDNHHRSTSFEAWARKLRPRQRLLLHDHFEYISRYSINSTLSKEEADHDDEDHDEQEEEEDHDDEEACRPSSSSSSSSYSQPPPATSLSSPRHVTKTSVSLEESARARAKPTSGTQDKTLDVQEQPPEPPLESTIFPSSILNILGHPSASHGSKCEALRKATQLLIETKEDDRMCLSRSELSLVVPMVCDLAEEESDDPDYASSDEYQTSSAGTDDVLRLALRFLKHTLQRVRSPIDLRPLLPTIIPLLSQTLGHDDSDLRNHAQGVFTALFPCLSNASLFLSLRGCFEHSHWRVRDEGLRVFIRGLLLRPEQRLDLDSSVVLSDLADLLLDRDSSQVQVSAREACVLLQRQSTTTNISDVFIEKGLLRDREDVEKLRKRLDLMEHMPKLHDNNQRLEYPILGGRNRNPNRNPNSTSRPSSSSSSPHPHSAAASTSFPLQPTTTASSSISISPRDLNLREELSSGSSSSSSSGFMKHTSRLKKPTTEFVDYRQAASSSLSTSKKNNDDDDMKSSDWVVSEPSSSSSSFATSPHYHQYHSSTTSSSGQQPPVRSRPQNQSEFEHPEPNPQIATRLKALKQRRSGRKGQRRAISANSILTNEASREYSSASGAPKSKKSIPSTPQETGSYDVHGSRTQAVVLSTISSPRREKSSLPDHDLSHGDERPIKPMKQMLLDEYGFDGAATRDSKHGRLFDGYEEESSGSQEHDDEEERGEQQQSRFVSKVTQRRIERKQQELLQSEKKKKNPHAKRHHTPVQTNHTTNNEDDAASASTSAPPLHPAKLALSSAIVYLSKEDLTSFRDPKKVIQTLLTKLKSKNWEENFEALTSIRRLCIHHADIFGPKAMTYVGDLLKQVNNLRSSVAKNAILALQSMFEDLRRLMEPAIDDILPILLKRAADTNAFIHQSAEICLEALVHHLHAGRICMGILPILQTSKSPLIRHGAAKTLDWSVKKMDHRFSTYKEADAVLKCLGGLLMDNTADVRGVAKNSVYYLVHQSIIDLNRMNRCMPSRAFEKLQQILNDHHNSSSGSRQYHSTANQSSSNSMTGSSSTTSSHVVSSHSHNISTSSSSSSRPVDYGKQRKKLHSRVAKDTAPPTNGNGSFFDNTNFLGIKKKLDSTNWRERYDAIEEIKVLLLSRPESFIKTKHAITIFEELSARLEDGNVKVNLCALSALQDIVPAYGNSLEPILSNFLSAVSGNLSASNRQIAKEAKIVLDQLFDVMEGRYLCQPIVELVRYGNPRTKPILLICLIDKIEEIYDDKPALVTKHVIPLSFSLLREIKSEIKHANYSLIKVLDQTLNYSLLRQYSDKLSKTDQEKVRQILGHD